MNPDFPIFLFSNLNFYQFEPRVNFLSVSALYLGKNPLNMFLHVGCTSTMQAAVLEVRAPRFPSAGATGVCGGPGLDRLDRFPFRKCSPSGRYV